MNAYRQPAPRGFRWADAPVGRAAVTVLAVLSILLSLYVGYRYVGLIDCLNDRDLADQRRTSAVANVTDAERVAQRTAIATTDEAARLAWLAAIDETDRVRAAYPAPSVVPCT